MTMTVRQLIYKLQQMDPDLVVALSSGGSREDEIGTGFANSVEMLEDGEDRREHGDDVVIIRA